MTQRAGDDVGFIDLDLDLDLDIPPDVGWETYLRSVLARARVFVPSARPGTSRVPPEAPSWRCSSRGGSPATARRRSGPEDTYHRVVRRIAQQIVAATRDSPGGERDPHGRAK
ncbi:hypothetical protein [Streptomyces sp. 3213.3]|uniref:hypothetical protein n=1 Tax=Streptomyces sp. 3213.3 TaxID=1855348 RepID=UPI0010424735|nr:hypothetical protein [Streptomyces sp. 3213.3]